MIGVTGVLKTLDPIAILCGTSRTVTDNVFRGVTGGTGGAFKEDLRLPEALRATTLPFPAVVETVLAGALPTALLAATGVLLSTGSVLTMTRLSSPVCTGLARTGLGFGFGFGFGFGLASASAQALVAATSAKLEIDMSQRR